MNKIILCSALATCIGTFPTAADADKLIANSDTGVNIHAMENHLGIDRNARTIIGYKTAETGTVLKSDTSGSLDARGGVLANTPLTEAEQKAAADAGVNVRVQTDAEAQALKEAEEAAEAQTEAQSNANIEAAAGSETNGDASVSTGRCKPYRG